MPEEEPEIEFSAGEEPAIDQFEYQRSEEFAEHSPEAESGNEPVADERPIDPGLEALLDHSGGRPEDWQVVGKGSGEYRFDGEHIVDRAGNVWTNPDAESHEALLEQWHEGGDAIFFLPDYAETKEADGATIETLYVTQLELDRQTGGVSWTISSHETISYEDETESTPDAKRESPSPEGAAHWEEFFGQRPANDNLEQAAAVFETAAHASVAERAEAGDSLERADARLDGLLARLSTATGAVRLSATAPAPEREERTPRLVGTALQGIGRSPAARNGGRLSAGTAKRGSEPARYQSSLNGILLERWAA